MSDDLTAAFADPIPRPGELLRELIRCAGWWPQMKALKLDKILDEVATESVPSRLLQKFDEVERAFLAQIEHEGGLRWRAVLGGAWEVTRNFLRDLSMKVDSAVLDDEAGRALFLNEFAVPQLAGMMRMVSVKLRGPVLTLWWRQPFEAWLAWAADLAGIDSDTLATWIEPDVDTVGRWRAGQGPIRKLRAPFAQYKPLQPLFHKVRRPALRQDLCGWLGLSLAFQSLPMALRERIRDAAGTDRGGPEQSYQLAIQALCDEVARRVGEARLPVLDLVAQIEDRFELRDAEGELADPQGIEAAVVRLGQCIEAMDPRWQASVRFLHERLAARLAVWRQQPEGAARLYSQAVRGCWWRAGLNQSDVLKEALLHAVARGDRRPALEIWNRLGLLGMHAKPRLDDLDWRLLAIGFEAEFKPLRAKFSAKEHQTNRVPADTEYRVGPWEPTARERKNPNQKMARDDGRTRRTPLMEAVMLGTLDDVKVMVAAGGDVNQCIPESGEGPLMYALRRAHMQKEREILDFLLDLGPSVETVNRVASTLRETPLAIAIQMGSAAVVERLIGLGARVGDECDGFDSALMYARALMAESQQLRASPQAFEAAWRQGGGRPNGDDARAGALFAADLPARRQAQFERQVAMADSQERRDRIAAAVMARMVPAPQDLEAVIGVLESALRGSPPSRG
ncbi:MAG: hypothetical protein QG612_2869 [Pseudomonadota bacterium]|nr:hypothetical protein [Pseudomonadota bacterium]